MIWLFVEPSRLNTNHMKTCILAYKFVVFGVYMLVIDTIGLLKCSGEWTRLCGRQSISKGTIWLGSFHRRHWVDRWYFPDNKLSYLYIYLRFPLLVFHSQIPYNIVASLSYIMFNIINPRTVHMQQTNNTTVRVNTFDAHELMWQTKTLKLTPFPTPSN